MKYVRICVPVLLVLHTLAVTVCAQTQTLTTASYAYTIHASGGPLNDNGEVGSEFFQSNVGTTVRILEEAMVEDLDTQTFMNVEVKAGIGDLGVGFRAVGVVQGFGSSTFSVPSLQASWLDDSVITVGTPNIFGAVVVDATIGVSGRLSSLVSSNAAGGTLRLKLKDIVPGRQSFGPAPIPDGFPLFVGPDIWGYVNNQSNLNLDLQPLGTEDVASIPVRHVMFPGQSYQMGYIIEVLADGSGVGDEGSYIISADYTHTLGWGGITSVRSLATNELIDDWTITSASGFDYSQPFVPEVPEPSSAALLGLALCLWLRRARSRGLRARSTNVPSSIQISLNDCTRVVADDRET